MPKLLGKSYTLFYQSKNELVQILEILYFSNKYQYREKRVVLEKLAFVITETLVQSNREHDRKVKKGLYLD